MNWRIVRPWCGALALWLATATSLALAQQTTPAAISTLDVFADSQTVVVARLNPAKVDAKNLIEFATPAFAKANLPADQQTQFENGLTQFQTTWRAGGGGELFLFVSLADVPLSPPFLVVEMAAGASVEKLRALIPADVFPEHALISGRLVFGRQETLQRVQKLSKQDQTELKGAFKAVEGAPLQVVAQLPPDVRRVVRELGGQPIPELGIGRVDELGAAFRWMAIGVDVAPRFSLRGALQADSPEGLERLRTAIQSAVRAGLAQPDLRVVAPAVNQLSSQLKLTAEDSRLRFDLSGDETTATLRDALVGPIMQARRSAQRAQSTNNLRQIALAFHNYHDTYRAFPPAASLSKDGKPLLSWRVHLLPFLDQGELYRQFKLDESWDSPHNRALIAKIPPVYVAPGLDAAAREGKTVYVVPVGEKSVFSTPRGTRIANITDGTSNTILALQSPAERAVVWTQPADWEFNPERPKEGVFLPGVADLVAALCDGSVRVISAQVAADVWRNLVQMNDGQVVGEF